MTAARPTRGFAGQVARRVRSSNASPRQNTAGLGEHKRAAGGDVAVSPKQRGGVHGDSAVESELLSEAKLRAILIEHGLIPPTAGSYLKTGSALKS